ncbi:MAG: hypothetical protein WDN01_00905 [Rhizomicrobium sp.]
MPLPLESNPALGRADFIVAPANAEAVAFVDSFPRWAAPAGALYGPSGSGKSHLVGAWAKAAGALIVPAAALTEGFVALLEQGRAVAVEDVDSGVDGRASNALFALFHHPGPLLLTGREPPAAWPAALPDLKSRFAALLAFPLWAPDEALLAQLTRKLFTDRQLTVPDPVIMRILRSVERSPRRRPRFRRPGGCPRPGGKTPGFRGPGRRVAGRGRAVMTESCACARLANYRTSV